MNFGELFTALAQKTMDGQENPVSVIFSSRLYEVQRYLTMWNYSYDPVILCVNKRLWDSLSPETREIFTRCAQDAMRYECDLVADGEPAIIDSLKAKGMEINTLTPEAIAEFRKLAEPLYAEFARETGNNLVKRFQDAVK